MRDGLRGFALWITTGFRAAPVVMTWGLIGSSLDGLLVPLEAYAVKLVVDGITENARAPLITAGSIFVGSLLYNHLYRSSMGNPIGSTTRDRVHGHLHADLIRLISGIPGLVHHERPEIADRIELLHRQAWDMSFNVLTFYGILISTTVSSIAVVGLLASTDPLLLVLALFGLLRVWAGLVESRARVAALERTATHTRRVERLVHIAASPRNGLETRVFGLRTMLIDRITQLLGTVAADRLHVSRVAARHQLLARAVYGIAYGVAIMLVVAKARSGDVSPGTVALVVLLGARIEHTTNQLATVTQESSATIRMFTRYAWLRRYARENASTNSTGTAPDRIRSAIVLRNVEFRYPGTERVVLSDIDLTLPAGSTVALVGENGAGKTTVVKLLARMYDPTAGSVLVDDCDLREIDPRVWRERCSAAYQDFVRFEFTAADAVGVGDLSRIDDEQALNAALQRGDAVSVVDALPAGLQTQLGTRFTDGVDLSGGQWQRLALARAFMRSEPLLLMLDEPTAAFDPEAEHALFERFAAASKATARRTGGITVLVSHRFSTVRMADLIVVLHAGRIDDIGTHTELIRRGGRYAELFELQARAYR